MNSPAPYAAQDTTSRGRQHEEPAPRFRSQYQRDRDRIVHSGAFRRLEYKTQVFVNHEGDMFRTRLTHSMEVAQLARTVARMLGLNEDLTEAIALAHDLGHTPFGHAGQDELNQCMQDHGGFEHNLQSLRVVDVLERRYMAFPGLNLTFESREGILKHCSRANARKLGEVGRRFLDRTQPCLEAQVADVADGIAYNNHDVDDGLRAQLIDLEQLREVRVFKYHHEQALNNWPDGDPKRIGYDTIRRIIDAQVSDLIVSSRAAIETAAVSSIDDVRNAGKPLIGFSEDMLDQHQQLKRFLNEHVYKHYRVRRMSSKAQRIVRQLFDALYGDPTLLPDGTRARMCQLEAQDSHHGKARAVADYIAGMTDRYAIAEHERIYNPSELT